MEILKHKKSITVAQTNIDNTDEKDLSENEQLWAPPANGLYAMNVKYDDDAYDNV